MEGISGSSTVLAGDEEAKLITLSAFFLGLFMKQTNCICVRMRGTNRNIHTHEKDRVCASQDTPTLLFLLKHTMKTEPL